MKDLSLLTNQITHMNLNYHDGRNHNDTPLVGATPSWVNRDPNEITEFIETVKNDYQSDIILRLFTDPSDRMYLVDLRGNLDNIEIDILNSGKSCKHGEKYTVIFNKLQTNFKCNCEDFLYRSKSRDIVCKHITFMVCKVLNVYDHMFFETKKLSSIYQERIEKIIDSHCILYNKYVLNTEESCPICCDAFGSSDKIYFAKYNNHVHENCLQILLEQPSASTLSI